MFPLIKKVSNRIAHERTLNICPALKILSSRLLVRTAVTCALVCSAFPLLRAATLPAGFAEQKIAEGLNPTSMAFAPDGRLFILEKDGKVDIVKNDVLLPTKFVTLTVDNYNERGLLGIAFDPQFTTNHWVYLYYTVPTSGGMPPYNRVSRFTANGDVAAPGETLIYKLDNLPSAGNHNGGSMFFDNAGYLYIAAGNAANGAYSQSTTTTHGKLLRINKDGSLPADNPFGKGIWAYGLRNPFVATYQTTSGKIYINDVGESTWEEINLGARGANYGFSGGATDGVLHATGKTDPIFTYQHHNPATTTTGSPRTGGAFYNPTSNQFPTNYIGKYFFADYVSGWIRYLDPNNTPTDPKTASAATIFATGITAPVSLRVAPDGSLWYLDRGSSAGGAGNNTGTKLGSVWKIRYTTNSSPTIASQPSPVTAPTGASASFSVSISGAGPFTYKWQRNGVDISGSTVTTSETTNTYTRTNLGSADNGATFRVVVTNASGSITSNGAILTVSSNQAPVVTISVRTADQLWLAGQTIHFSATALDPEDGALPASAYQWSVTLNHKGTGAAHQHPFIDLISGVSSGTFVIPSSGEAGGDIDDKLWLTITLNVRDSGNQAASASTDIYALRNADNPPILAAGLDRKLYAGQWSVLPSFDTLVPVSVGTTANFDINPNTANNQNFGLTFDGYIDAPVNGIYTFYLNSDDGSRLLIGSREVVNSDGLHNSGTERSGNIALQAGRHAIRVEYFQRAGDIGLNVRWSGPGIAKQLVPSNRLFRNAAAAFDNFSDNRISPLWSFVNGSWSEDEQILTQTSLTAQDPKKALIKPADAPVPNDATITARVRVESWTPGDRARAGVSLNSGSGNGEGINLIFHGVNQVSFLDDKRTYGPAYTFNWTPGTWYWFKLKRTGGTYSGKVWANGTGEPASWPYSWVRSGRDGGFPALNGGSGDCSVSFDDVTVETGAVAPAIVASASHMAVPEGASATLTAHLASPPAGNTTVTVVRSAGSPNLTVSGGSSLKFTTANWSVPQTVTLSSASDVLDATNNEATFSIGGPELSTVNVTATQTDDDFQSSTDLGGTSQALLPTNIGAGTTGAGTVRNSGIWWVRGDGNGIGGTADGIHLEGRTITGDFQVVARLRSFTSSGGAPRTGVIIRESAAPGARSVAVLTKPPTAGNYVINRRLTTDGAATESDATGAGSTYSYDQAWVILIRQGDTISVGTSVNGLDWTEINRFTLPALGANVQAGLISTSGSVSFPALAAVSDFDIIPTSANAYEMENLTVAGKSDDVHRIIGWVPFSGGTGTILDSDAVGDFVTYRIPNVLSGNYNVRVGIKPLTTRGIWQLSVDGSNLGTPQNSDLPGNAVVELDLGPLNFPASGDRTFRFTITGKDPHSSGYTEAFDFIKLTPIP